MAHRVIREVYSVRFKLAYGLLAIVLGIAIGGAVVLSGRSGEAGANWSAWKPSGSSDEKMQQIAEFVSRQYRSDDGRQLLAVYGGPPVIQQVPIEHFVIAQGSTASDLKVDQTNGSIVYQLCGLGKGCAVLTGRPSLKRGALIRRESLELALYTFKYVDGVNSVVAFLPATPGKTPTYAVYLKKDQVSNALSRPLARTLKPTAEIQPSGMTPRDTSIIRKLDLENLYKFSFQQAPDGSAILVLANPGA